LAEGMVSDDPAVILGIGINVHQARHDWPPELVDRAASLAMLGVTVERSAVLRVALARLGAGYERHRASGFESVREAWRGRGLLGDPVAIGPGERGLAEDLDAGGRLLVRKADGAVVVLAATDPAG